MKRLTSRDISHPGIRHVTSVTQAYVFHSMLYEDKVNRKVNYLHSVLPFRVLKGENIYSHLLAQTFMKSCERNSNEKCSKVLHEKAHKSRDCKKSLDLKETLTSYESPKCFAASVKTPPSWKMFWNHTYGTHKRKYYFSVTGFFRLRRLDLLCSCKTVKSLSTEQFTRSKIYAPV